MGASPQGQSKMPKTVYSNNGNFKNGENNLEKTGFSPERERYVNSQRINQAHANSLQNKLTNTFDVPKASQATNIQVKPALEQQLKNTSSTPTIPVVKPLKTVLEPEVIVPTTMTPRSPITSPVASATSNSSTFTELGMQIEKNVQNNKTNLPTSLLKVPYPQEPNKGQESPFKEVTKSQNALLHQKQIVPERKYNEVAKDYKEKNKRISSISDNQTKKYEILTSMNNKLGEELALYPNDIMKTQAIHQKFPRILDIEVDKSQPVLERLKKEKDSYLKKGAKNEHATSAIPSKRKWRIMIRPLDVEYGENLFNAYKDSESKVDLIPFHQHFVADDGTDIGFFNKGITPDNPKFIGKMIESQEFKGLELHDTYIQAAIELLSEKYQGKDYSLATHNCQDFIRETISLGEELAKINGESIYL